MRNKIKRMFEQLKAKLVKPKVYALLLEDGGREYLTVQMAYSLEEAYRHCRKEFQNLSQTTRFDIAAANLKMWKVAEVESLSKNLSGFEITEPDAKKVERRNKKDEVITSAQKEISELMKKIIDSKDRKLFEAEKHRLSKAERVYVESRLKESN